MTVKVVLRMGDPRLYRVAGPVDAFDTETLHALVQDLYDTMAAYQGAGICAPQIGVNLRVMVFGVETPRYPRTHDVPETVLINPEITVMDADMEDYWEGCLSVPGFRGLVPRPNHIVYRGYDMQGNLIEREAKGFHARVVQHEYDHLDGILFPMRVNNLAYFSCEEEFGFNHIIKKMKVAPVE